MRAPSQQQQREDVDARKSPFPKPQCRPSPAPFQRHRHQLLILILLQLLLSLKVTSTHAMIYLEDPAHAKLYDSLPYLLNADQYAITKEFLVNLTEAGLENVSFKVGTPFHYLKVSSSTIISDDNTAPAIGSNATTVTNNDTFAITNYTNNHTNETIEATTTTHDTTTTNNSTVFERRTLLFAIVAGDSSPEALPAYSSATTSREIISDEQTDTTTTTIDIIHHNNITTTIDIINLNNNNDNPLLSLNTYDGGDILLIDSHENTLTVSELLGYFNDTKLISYGNQDGTVLTTQEEEEKYLYYDSRQAMFGSDLGPIGNAAFVNIMLPPRWGEKEREEGKDANHLLGLHDDDSDESSHQQEEENASKNQTQTKEDEELFSSELLSFDTHISSYFCLDDFIRWRSSSNVSFAPITSSSSSNSTSGINSTRGIALMVQRGRCSFEDKAKLAMVINDLLASSGKSNRIDHVIVYNNGTIDEANNATSTTDGDGERLVEMRPNDTYNGRIDVGMVFISTTSGFDLMKRITEWQNGGGISPHLNITSSILLPTQDSSSGWSRKRHLLVSESTKDDEQQQQQQQQEGSLVEGNIMIHDESITNGWFFPATLTRFCLSCGQGNGFGNPYGLTEDGTQYRPGFDPGPTNWPNVLSDDYYEPRRWVEMIRRLMIAILVLLLVGPGVLAAHRWRTVGGTVRVTTDENGRRRVRVISPNLDVFVNGVPDSVETNGTKLDRAQVFALPEIVYSPSSAHHLTVNEDVDSQMFSNNTSDDNDVESGASPDSFLENDNRFNDDNESNIGPEPPALISPSGSEASDMFASSSCCSICIEEFELGEKLRVLPRCNHLFHTECILPWLTKRQGCCPQCRTPVLPDEFQRSRRSSPRRQSSVLRSSRGERQQQGGESFTTALTPTRLFSEGGDSREPIAGVTQENQSALIPNGVEGNESNSSQAEGASVSSPGIMEQGIIGDEEPVGDNDSMSGDAGIVVAVSADDMEISAVSRGDDREDEAVTNAVGISARKDTNRNSAVDNHNIDSCGDDGFNAFLSFLHTPSDARQGARAADNDND